MSRGAKHWITGPDEVATSLGMEGVISAGAANEDEGLYPVQHGHWLEVMRQALAQEESQRATTSAAGRQNPDTAADTAAASA